MNSIHFFKGYSHMGITQTDEDPVVRRGLAHGSDAVLTPEFIAEFPGATLNSYTFSDPIRVPDSDYLPRLTHDLTICANTIDATMPPEGIQVVVGGDHSVTCASLMRILRHHTPEDVGIIHIDTHGDIHQRSTSPSGNFHGMFLRPFFETFDIPEIDALVPHKIPPTHLLSIGNTDFEPEEWDYYRTHGIKNITGLELEKNPSETHATIRAFINQFKHIHLSFDIDVFHASLVTATGMPNPDGLTREHLFPILKILASHPSVSLDLMEINLALPGINETAHLAQDSIRALFKK